MGTGTKEEVLTTAQLAARWGYRPQTLREWRQKGVGPKWFRPSGLPAGKVVYRLADVEAWEQANGIVPNGHR